MRQFDRRARMFERADYLYREVEHRMLERLELVRLQPLRVLDVGCGLGDGARRLRTRYPQAHVIGADLAVALVMRARSIDRPSLGDRARGIARRLAGSLAGGSSDPTPGRALASYVAADAHRMPLVSSSIDLVWSSLAFHWFDDPLAAIAEWHRVIRPGGLLMFSAFGVDTLQELRGAGCATMGLPDMHDIGDALMTAGFAEPVMDTERLTVTWGDPVRMLDELHALGGNALKNRRRGLLTPRGLQAVLGTRRDRLSEALPTGVTPARLGATFELIYGHAWCPPVKKLPDGYAPIEFRPSNRRPGAST